MTKRKRRWLGLGIGAAILILVGYNLRHSPTWRNFNWTRLWHSVTSARPEWLLAAVGVVYTTYLIRAVRWKFFMSQIKNASLRSLYAAQILGFSSIYLIGRPGEFVRPAYIAKKEDVPITSMLAVWLMERMFDAVFLVLLFSLALSLIPAGQMTSRGTKVLSDLHHAGEVMLGVSALLVALIVAYRLRTEQVAGWVLRAFASFSAKTQRHAEHFLKSFAEGLGVIRDWPSFLASALLTALLWCMNATIFWMVFRSLRGALAAMPWLAAAMVMFCAALGLAVQLPGIGGGYQMAIILALTEVFAIEADVAAGAAILVWLVMIVPALAMAVILLVHEGLSIRRLKAIAAEEESAAELAEKEAAQK
jgi:uncharacterized protein (TIRG00374 family)